MGRCRSTNTFSDAGLSSVTIPAAGSFHDRPNLWGWCRDPFWVLKTDETEHGGWHRCDIRWQAFSASGTLLAEGPNVLFFRFPSRKKRERVHRIFFERGIHCLRYPGRILAIWAPYLTPECEECQEGATYVPGE
jgi:hypothetical protein